jgi:hypothetical protein
MIEKPGMPSLPGHPPDSGWLGMFFAPNLLLCWRQPLFYSRILRYDRTIQLAFLFRC